MKTNSLGLGLASLVIVPGLVGCGATHTTLSLNNGTVPTLSNGTVPTLNKPKPPRPIIDTTGLTLKVTPTSGPSGTLVTITVTGCGDTAGDNHAMSYNEGNLPAMTAAGNAAVHAIALTAKGTTLTGTYKIPDKTPESSMFYFACGSTVPTVAFMVTR